jgi:hypothetical protein
MVCEKGQEEPAVHDPTLKNLQGTCERSLADHTYNSSISYTLEIDCLTIRTFRGGLSLGGFILRLLLMCKLIVDFLSGRHGIDEVLQSPLYQESV